MIQTGQFSVIKIRIIKLSYIFKPISEVNCNRFLLNNTYGIILNGCNWFRFQLNDIMIKLLYTYYTII